MTTTNLSPEQTEARSFIEANDPDLLAGFDESGRREREENCTRCGGSGYVRPWGTCFRCNGNPARYRRVWTETYVDVAAQLKKRIKKSEAAARKAAREQAKRDAARSEFLAANPGLEGALSIDDVSILRSFSVQLDRKGTLSERQVEVALKVAADRYQAEQVAVDAPEGRLDVEGEIVSVKEGTFRMRMTLKVTTPEGGEWLANGSLPASIAALDGSPDGEFSELVGRRVALTATFERSDRRGFAFFKRPAKGREA